MNYIPKCLICGKDMIISINGSKGAITSHNYNTINIKMDLNENLLVSKNKNYQLSINIDDNTICDGQTLIESMSVRSINLNKNCSTCFFKIKAINDSIDKIRAGIFPSILLDKEELHYTKTKGRSVNIINYRSLWDLSHHTDINIDNKRVKSYNFDLSKFKNLTHLNNRLSTLITFQ